MTTDALDARQEIAKLKRQVVALRNALCSAIAWMSQSANSPISLVEAKQLIGLAERDMDVED